MLAYDDVMLLASLGILGANSYTDIARRTMCGGDWVYVVLGVAGLAAWTVHLASGAGAHSAYVILGMASGITVALAAYRYRLIASGDCVIIMVVSAVLPMYYGVILVPVLVVAGAVVMLAWVLSSYNVILNTSDVLRGRCLFGLYEKAGTLKRIAAFAAAHRKRAWERHVISIEENADFDLSTAPFGKTDWRAVRTGGLVMVAAPVMPFMLLALLFVAVWVRAFA